MCLGHPRRMVGHSFLAFLSYTPFAHKQPCRWLLPATSTATSTCLWAKHILICAGPASAASQHISATSYHDRLRCLFHAPLFLL